MNDTILVYAKCYQPEAVDISGSFTIPVPSSERHCVVGMLDRPVDIGDHAMFEATRMDFEVRGVKLEIVCQPTYEGENYISCLLTAGVFVETMDQARALSGFTPIGRDTGKVLLPGKTVVDVLDDV